MTSEHMRRALELADSVLGSTSPNPAVGCVIVRDGRVIAEGATQPPGQAHAEVVALRAAGDAARGADVYVTLEPHNFTGRTPPCTEALIAAGVRVVHVSMLDPNPRVSGGGVAQLRAAGIAVEAGDGEADSRRLLEGYLKHCATGLPFVVAKFAATLDGKIAASSGDSRWVAGEAARAWAHNVRTKVDAIMCGVNNVLLDDPRLTARPGGVDAARQPLRIVADSRGRTPLDANVLGAGGPTIIATTEASPEGWRMDVERAGAEALVLPADAQGRVDLHALMRALGERGVLTLLVEGGGVLHASLFEAGLVDKVHAIIAPKIVGGSAYPAVAGAGVAHMADAITLQDIEVEPLGDDIAVIGYVNGASER
ncbi:MAG TPA: bifunctional diaminohydroxyphosphoribosylaminopyrimidine deaminase/5-amino-6-(5-phosphoribosylamino)uracil reductase RibD [Dehalococcoidia bacterium]|nr:bifunctional diaminohydroxyphosphoribosylaminopyrimidine deaminase/5-amino-6-(5-phosphoribosylamino)uracil reductase RibD [Dehalococcoidia bacterium]